jgi:hypothetical protein
MLLFAGHETTMVRIDLGMLLLITQPDQYRALRDDPGLINSAVDEVLRLSSISAIGGLPRYASADITIDDATIAAGDAVLLATSAANRDPRVFTDPDTFDITRTPNPHLAFGHGPATASAQASPGSNSARFSTASPTDSRSWNLPSPRKSPSPQEKPHRRLDRATSYMVSEFILGRPVLDMPARRRSSIDALWVIPHQVRIRYDPAHAVSPRRKSSRHCPSLMADGVCCG